MKKIAILLSLLFSFTLLQGCHSSSTNSQSTVRLVNGTTTPLDMYWSATGSVSGVATSIDYGTASSAVTSSDGVSTVQLATSGNSASGGSTFSFGGGTSYTMLAYPSYASGSNGQVSSLQVMQLIDNQTTPNSGNALLGVVDRSGAGSLDVYVAAGTSIPTVTWGHNISGTLQYTTLPLPTTTGTTAYHIQVTGAGAGYGNDVRLDIPAVNVATPVTIGNQQILTLVLTQTTGGTLVDGLVFFQQGQTLLSGQQMVASYKNGSARVRIAASFVAPGTPSISAATANGFSILSSSLSSGSTPSPYVTVPLLTGGTPASPQSTGQFAGAQAFPILINGTAISVSSSCASQTATALPGQDVTLLVLGNAASPQYCLLSDDNTLAGSGYAKLRLVNGLNNSNGLIASLIYGGGAQVPPQYAAFGAASFSTPVPLSINAPYSIVGFPVGTTTLDTPSPPPLATQGVYTVFMLGDNMSAASAVLSADHLFAY